MTHLEETVFPTIEKTIAALSFETIFPERKKALRPLIDYIQSKVNSDEDIRLNFICTHNSRRSHLSQIWAQTAAAHYKIKNVFSYSGGTEATDLFPMIAQVVQQTGFQVKTISKGNNPIYSIKYNENSHPLICFSKTYDDSFNPKSKFAAILTCSEADDGCPFIAGAEKRIAIPYEDPKVFDNSPQQTQKYQERSFQIATELFYVFSLIK